jgi:hypothetical protein
VITDCRTRLGYIVRWWVEPCSDPDHERPARESYPPDPRLPVYGPPEPPLVTPGRSALLAEFNGVAINDYVVIDGISGVGRVKYLKSAFGVGVYVSVGYPDGRQFSKRTGELRVVAKPVGHSVGEPS